MPRPVGTGGYRGLMVLGEANVTVKITGIDHVGIAVPDLDAAIA